VCTMIAVYYNADDLYRHYFTDRCEMGVVGAEGGSMRRIVVRIPSVIFESVACWSSCLRFFFVACCIELLGLILAAPVMYVMDHQRWWRTSMRGGWADAHPSTSRAALVWAGFGRDVVEPSHLAAEDAPGHCVEA
jgi:hypothetical protein